METSSEYNLRLVSLVSAMMVPMYPLLSQYHLDFKRVGDYGMVFCDYTSTVDAEEWKFILFSVVLTVTIRIFQKYTFRRALYLSTIHAIGNILLYMGGRSATNIQGRKTYFGLEDYPVFHKIYMNTSGFIISCAVIQSLCSDTATFKERLWEGRYLGIWAFLGGVITTSLAVISQTESYDENETLYGIMSFVMILCYFPYWYWIWFLL